MAKDKLDVACELLLDKIRTLDPTWQTNIQAALEEHHWSAWQLVGACVGYVMDNDLHMTIPPHPAFEPGFVGVTGDGACEHCGAPFVAAWAGQRYCKNDCANAALNPPSRPAAEQLVALPLYTDE